MTLFSFNRATQHKDLFFYFLRRRRKETHRETVEISLIASHLDSFVWCSSREFGVVCDHLECSFIFSFYSRSQEKENLFVCVCVCVCHCQVPTVDSCAKSSNNLISFIYWSLSRLFSLRLTVNGVERTSPGPSFLNPRPLFSLSLAKTRERESFSRGPWEIEQSSSFVFFFFFVVVEKFNASAECDSVIIVYKRKKRKFSLLLPVLR